MLMKNYFIQTLFVITFNCNYLIKFVLDCVIIHIYKGKMIQLQAQCGPEDG